MESTKHGMNFNVQAALRAQDLRVIKEKLLDKERDLSHAERQYQDLMQKIKVI